MSSTDSKCKYCHKKPRFTDDSGNITSVYCSNVCAKKAGGPLPNPETLVKRSKTLSLTELLKQEADIERGKADPTEPASVTALARKGIWKITSIDGQTDIILNRTYRNETIRVEFAMAELDPFEPDEDSDDEDESGANGRGRDADEESIDDVMEEPVECTVSIARAHHGALLFDCWASPEELEILKISFIKDEKLVLENSAEAERKLMAMGVGPEYDDLPKRIKEEFFSYLNERGINNELAQFMNDFVKYKTAKEAQGWFDHVAKFVSNN